MPRETDGLANVLIALCELEKSAILSESTRNRIKILKERVEQELQSSHDESPATIS